MRAWIVKIMALLLVTVFLGACGTIVHDEELFSDTDRRSSIDVPNNYQLVDPMLGMAAESQDSNSTNNGHTHLTAFDKALLGTLSSTIAQDNRQSRYFVERENAPRKKYYASGDYLYMLEPETVDIEAEAYDLQQQDIDVVE